MFRDGRVCEEPRVLYQFGSKVMRRAEELSSTSDGHPACAVCLSEASSYSRPSLGAAAIYASGKGRASVDAKRFPQIATIGSRHG